tara:strand:+ start:10649 stop:10948 length:300 start_codon:yes stop_codon:yes gene_type:complete
MAGIHKLTVQEAQNAKLGQAGYKHITTGGTANTGTAAAGVEYVAVLSHNDATKITTESNDTDLYPDLTTVLLPAGCWLYGRWKKVTITETNGAASVYRG